MSKPRSIEIRDFTSMKNATFFDTPRFDGATGAEIDGVTISGDPGTACGLTATIDGTSSNPGNGAGWFAGGDQNPPCPQVVLDFSEPLRAFGVSFIHINQAGLDTTNPGRLRVFNSEGGTGKCIGEIISTGGANTIDFVGLASKVQPIRSAIVDSNVDNTSYCVDGYAILKGKLSD